MNTAKFRLALVALLVALLPALAGAQPITPPTVNYQGRVTLDGIPYHDLGHFKFAVVDSLGNTTWSNDGTSSGGSEPERPIELEVRNGLFNVLLGDTTLDPMVPLPATSFGEDTEPYLRVWFSSGGSFEQLAPDRRFASLPYALQAEVARDAARLGGENPSAVAPADHGHTPDEVAPQGAGSGLQADLLDGQHGSYYQARVSAACAVGSTVRPSTPTEASRARSTALVRHLAARLSTAKAMSVFTIPLQLESMA